MAIELPSGYYHDNFNQLLTQVEEHYADLLSETERAFLQRYRVLEADAQRLLVRLLCRKGPWFRLSQLSYREMADLDAAAQQLLDAGLLLRHPLDPAPELLPLFNKRECLTRAERCHLATQALKPLKRQALEQALCAQLDSTQWRQFLADERYVCVARPECFDTFRLLFFGNLHQTLSEFVLRDLGLTRFEPYELSPQTRRFSTRESIEAALHLHQLSGQLDQSMRADASSIAAFAKTLPQRALDNAYVRKRRQHLLEQLARQLERLHAHPEAIELYQQCDSVFARERLIRTLAKQGDDKRALALCQQLREHSEHESERQFAQAFGHRLSRKGDTPWPAPKRYAPPEAQITLTATDATVEALACQHYSAEGRCFYVENALFNSVFGLHHWTLLFAPIDGAFSHPFQWRPHDLYEPEFLSRRQTHYRQTQQSLPDLHQQPERYVELWQHKLGTANPFVFWAALDEDTLRLALARIPTAHWQAIFSRLWQDLKAHRSGFPDLILFPASGGYRLIEIKAPGDRLQAHQLQWMAYFQQHEIPHQVTHVQWA